MFEEEETIIPGIFMTLTLLIPTIIIFVYVSRQKLKTIKTEPVKIIETKEQTIFLPSMNNRKKQLITSKNINKESDYLISKNVVVGEKPSHNQVQIQQKILLITNKFCLTIIILSVILEFLLGGVLLVYPEINILFGGVDSNQAYFSPIFQRMWFSLLVAFNGMYLYTIWYEYHTTIKLIHTLLSNLYIFLSLHIIRTFYYFLLVFIGFLLTLIETFISNIHYPTNLTNTPSVVVFTTSFIIVVLIFVVHVIVLVGLYNSIKVQ